MNQPVFLTDAGYFNVYVFSPLEVVQKAAENPRLSSASRTRKRTLRRFFSPFLDLLATFSMSATALNLLPWQANIVVLELCGRVRLIQHLFEHALKTKSKKSGD
mgnify:CR=1 FL=1